MLLKEKVSVALKATGQFIVENRKPLIQVAVMVGVFAIMQDSAFAQETITNSSVTGTNSKGNFDMITKPMNTMSNLMTGPVPKAIATIACAIGGASWAMNIENQVTKAAMRVIGGGGVAMGAGAFVTAATGILF